MPNSSTSLPSRPSTTPSRPLPRHLIDLDNPRPRSPHTGMSVTQVQRWVSTVLTITIVGHFTAGLLLSAVMVGDGQLAPRIGLNVLATITATLMVGGVRAIHAKSLLSPWLALGLLVGLLGYVLTFRISW